MGIRNQRVMVLLSSYNGEKYIAAQIESIMQQKDISHIELLIRDDGSTDGTKDIIKKLVEKYGNILLIEGANIGYVASYFTLIQECGGYDYYALSDQDDIWLDDKISCAIDALEKYDDEPVLYGSTSMLVREDLVPFGKTQEQLREITFCNSMIQNFFPGHTQVFNNELLKLLKRPFDCSQIYVHDSWITNVAVIKGRVVFDNVPHTYYRQHSNNELGFSKGIVSWVRERMKRIQKADGKKYARQIEYLYCEFKDELDKESRTEMEKYRKCQKNIMTRLHYVIVSKLYRQKKIETLFFKVLYLVGGYNN
ncbi:MAG: glycosyltransferase family 2 protein [Eubacteriales bacterium]